MQLTRRFTFACLFSVMLVAFSVQAFAATYAEVGTCVVPFTAAHSYTTIQAAVTASKAGTIIEICPGTYPEQVSIDKNLTIEGVASSGQDAAVIVPPSGGLVQNTTDFDNSDFPTAAQILVQDSVTVTIINLTVDGTGSTGNNIGACGPPGLVGILFQNASGTVNHVAVRNQLVDGNVISGCQTGLGIYAQTAAGFTSKVTVEGSSVHNYNKNGITGNDPGTTLIVSNDYVQGSGAVPNVAAQNGIQIGFGATGTIKVSTVIDNVYTDSSAAATDILLYDTVSGSGVLVNENTVGNSQIPIALYTDDGTGNSISVTSNKIFGTVTFDAIDVCTNGNTITGNTIVNSADSAIHFDSGCGGTGENNYANANIILESECAGILDDWSGTAGNYDNNPESYYTVPFPLIGSTGSCPFIAGEDTARTNNLKTKSKNKISPLGRRK